MTKATVDLIVPIRAARARWEQARARTCLPTTLCGRSREIRFGTGEFRTRPRSVGASADRLYALETRTDMTKARTAVLERGRIARLVVVSFAFAVGALPLAASAQHDDPTNLSLRVAPTKAPHSWVHWGAAREQERYRELVSELEAQLTSQGIPGGAVGIVAHNRTRFVAGFGVKEAGGTAPVDGDTRFRIGSISKTFTAVLATQLAVEHAVSLDAPLTRYLPDLQLHAPHNPAELTLRRLLSHTAGVPDTTELACADGNSLEAWFDGHPELTLWTPPGRLFSYSNLGFSLAGLALESAIGVPYRELVEQRILEPLGLESMTFDLSEAVAGDHAVGFSPESGGTTLVECALVDPAGGLWSSARDLASFAATLLRGGDGVINRRVLWAMRAPETVTDPGGDATYGLGLVDIERGAMRIVGHNGGLPGYRAEMWLVPNRDFGLVLLVNGDVDTTPLALAALAHLLELPEVQPVDRTTPPSAWSDYLGVYEEEQQPTAFPEPWIGTVVVDLEGGHLFMRDVENTERLPMRQLAGDSWIVTVEDGFDLPVTFWRDRRGRVEYIASRSGAVHRISGLD
jgi:CubicO group peptidase (beta-lactamase class C family)